MAESNQLAEGARIGRFTIVRRIGAGGMGAVFEARDPELSRSVAVKVLHDRGGDTVRLVREAQALAQISHPNVVAVYEVGTWEGRVFVAMELIDGVTLDREKSGGWRATLARYVAAGRGLAAVHAQGLVHRDVKPSNLLVDRAGRVKVGDFGLARRASDVVSDVAGDGGDRAVSGDDITAPASDADTAPEPRSDGLLAVPITAHGARVGTPRYMAPEQHAGGAVTAAADQFAFCVALWEAICGQHPFGDGPDLVQAVIDGRRRPAPRSRSPAPGSRGAPGAPGSPGSPGSPGWPRCGAPGWPRWIERALARGLARDPAARWPSMTALCDQLERVPRRRRRTALAAAAIGVVAIAAVGGGVVMAQRAPRVSCDDAAAAAAGTWGATARGAITAGFAATGRPWANDEGARVVRAIDAWVTRWRGVRIDACRAGRQRGDESAAMLDRRAACLDAQLGQLDALTAALAHPDAAALEHARDAVSALPAPETCTAVRLAGAAPSAGPDGAPVAHLIDVARAAVDLGGPGALTAAAGALDAARALGDPALRARALMIDAAARAPTEADRQRADLEEAMSDAAAAHDPVLEAEAIFHALDYQDRSGREALLPVLRAAVKRGGETAELRRTLAVGELKLAMAAGDHAAARAACGRTIELAIDPHMRARYHYQCDCQVAVIARDPSAVDGCRAAYDAYRADSGDDSIDAASAARMYAVALERAGKLDDADAIHRGNVPRLERLYGPDAVPLAAALQDWALVQDEAHHPELARDTVGRAAAILERTGRTTGRAYYPVLETMATLDGELGRSDDAVREATQAVALAEKELPPGSPDLIALVSTQAEVMSRLPDRAPARAAWQRAATLAAELDPGDPMRSLIAESQADFLYGDGHPTEALTIARRALTGFEALANPSYLADTHRLIGNILIDLHRAGEGRAELLAARGFYAQLGDAGAHEVEALDRRLHGQ